jgi:ribosomal protein L37AE/L43A
MSNELDLVMVAMASKMKINPGAIVVGMVVAGLIGFAIGKGKGHGLAGFFLGAFLGLIGWIIVGVMKPAAPAVGGAPFCSTCGQQAIWAQTYWSCTRCQKAVPVGGPAPQQAQGFPQPPQQSYPQPQAPNCQTCGKPGRWMAESNGWGCDGCRQMIMAAPTAPPPA